MIAILNMKVKGFTSKIIYLYLSSASNSDVQDPTGMECRWRAKSALRIFISASYFMKNIPAEIIEVISSLRHII